MSKKKTIIANWKMNLAEKEAIELASKVKQGLQVFAEEVEVALCPAFVWLKSVKEVLGDSEIKLGAQTCFWEEEGAYTGEIGTAMLKELGVSYVILGHSERRENLKEDDRMINKKVKAVIKAGMTPVVCIGETWDERSEGKKEVVISAQIRNVLGGVRPIGKQEIILVYEPVWAISTSKIAKPATAEDVALMHALIRDNLSELYPADVVGRQFRIIYGGSVNSKNIEDYLDREEIEGALVGAASLKADEFIKLVGKVVK